MFSNLAAEYEERFGLDRAHLRGISEIAFANAKRNPNSQTRNWAITPDHLGDDDDLKGAVLLFASAAGKHITGQILAVDGGVSALVG